MFSAFMLDVLGLAKKELRSKGDEQLLHHCCGKFSNSWPVKT